LHKMNTACNEQKALAGHRSVCDATWNWLQL